MKLNIEDTGIPGYMKLCLPRFDDSRGVFQKVFQSSAFVELGLETRMSEVYFTHSGMGVLRGLHFQSPPHEHAKIVCCLAGTAHDVVLDIRRGSPTFGKHVAVRLSAETPTALYVGPGLAHGFLSLSSATTILYMVSTEHAPSHDQGIRWDSAGIDWPLTGEPVVSSRDQAFPRFNEYETPFL